MVDATLPITPMSAGSDGAVLAEAGRWRRAARERFFQRGATGFLAPALVGAVVACGSFLASTAAVDAASAAPHVRHMFVGAFLFGSSFIGAFAALAAALAYSEHTSRRTRRSGPSLRVVVVEVLDRAECARLVRRAAQTIATWTADERCGDSNRRTTHG